MNSGWDFVQALSVLRSPVRSHGNYTDVTPTVPCWTRSGPANLWNFDSIRSALHSDVGKSVLKEAGKISQAIVAIASHHLYQVVINILQMRGT